jgi:Glyoxalase/Bleomycin resistance protein/Dioxygenase superfamily
MKRFHVHVSVDELEASIRFYSTLFGAQPSVLESDYAKWMLEDPRVNFAISKRGARPGLDHLGIQVETDSELSALRSRTQEAEIAAFDQSNAACCYARSDKYWVTDPQGIAWETFHTLDSIPVFGADVRAAPPAVQTASACCAPAAKPIAIPVRAAGGSCCG